MSYSWLHLTVLKSPWPALRGGAHQRMAREEETRGRTREPLDRWRSWAPQTHLRSSALTTWRLDDLTTWRLDGRAELKRERVYTQFMHSLCRLSKKEKPRCTLLRPSKSTMHNVSTFGVQYFIICWLLISIHFSLIILFIATYCIFVLVCSDTCWVIAAHSFT